MTIVITNELLWASAAVAGVVDAGLYLLFVRRVPKERFRALGWTLPLAALLFWVGLWTAVLALGWDSFYRYVFPEWTRSVAPLLGLVYAGVAVLLQALASRLPGNSSLNWCLLGGAEGFVSHVWAVLGLGVIDRVPMLHGASAAAVIAFAVFEKIAYWTVILLLAVLLHRLRRVRSPAT